VAAAMHAVAAVAAAAMLRVEAVTAPSPSGAERRP
jgi:hypothetical protein